MQITAPPATVRISRACPTGARCLHPAECRTAAVVAGGYESYMPGFADVLSDAEIRVVLDYIKTTWPERERGYQLKVSRSG